MRKRAISQVIFFALDNRNDVEIYRATLDLVEKVLRDPANAEEVVANGGIELVLYCLKQNQIDYQILELGLKVM